MGHCSICPRLDGEAADRHAAVRSAALGLLAPPTNTPVANGRVPERKPGRCRGFMFFRLSGSGEVAAFRPRRGRFGHYRKRAARRVRRTFGGRSPRLCAIAKRGCFLPALRRKNLLAVAPRSPVPPFPP